MKTLALLTLLLITSGSALGQMLKSNVSGFVGEDVLLSFNCYNDPNELIWQKGNRVVNGYSQDPVSIDDSYVDRTKLFINKQKRNCSLLLHNLSTADAGLYTSYAIVSVHNNVWSSMSSEVNLTVSETESNHGQVIQNEDISATAVSVSVPILVVMLILAVILLLTILIKRRHWRNTETNLPAEKVMLQTV